MAASLSLFSEANSYPCYPLEGSGKVLFHCAECRKTFVSFAGVRTHSCNGTESNTPGEKTTTTTQGHICQDFVIGACHLTDEHRVQLEFPTMAEAMNWLEEHELDKDLRIRTSSAKRKVFQCRCALKRQTQTRKILKPLQESQVPPSTKVNDCPAKLLFIRVVRCQCPQPESRQRCLVSSEVVQVMGCLSHSHPIEKRDMRLSQAAKGYAADLLKSGLEPKVILDQYFPMAEGDDCTRPITRSDLYRMGQTPELLGYDPKANEVTNVTKFMATTPFRAFNYGKKFDMSRFPDALQGKVVETNGLFLLCYASDKMLQKFRDHPTIIAIDGTHGTNSAKYVLISILVFGRDALLPETGEVETGVNDVI